MNKALGVVVGLIGIVILMIIFPIVMSATHDLQTDVQTDVFEGVTTGAGETAADVVLTVDLYQDETAHVLSVTSDNESDTPVAGTYTAATNTLNVTGLAESDTRTLTVQYEYDALTNYTGMGALVGITPLLIWVAILATVVAGTWFAFKKGT